MQHHWSYHRVQTVDIKKSLDACTTIFDMAYHKVFPSIPTTMTWKIAGAVSLPHRGSDNDLMGADVGALFHSLSMYTYGAVFLSFLMYKSGFLIPSSCTNPVVILAQNIVFSVQNILNESRYFFDIIAFRSGQRQRQLKIFIKPEVKHFLLDEARSRDFYFAYRRSTTLEFHGILEFYGILDSGRYVMVSQAILAS